MRVILFRILEYICNNHLYQQDMKKIIALLLLILFIPQLVSAVWWNPFSWFSKPTMANDASAKISEPINTNNSNAIISDETSSDLSSQDTLAALKSEIEILMGRISDLESELDKSKIERDALRKENDVLRSQADSKTNQAATVKTTTISQSQITELNKNREYLDALRNLETENNAKYDDSIKAIQDQLNDLLAEHLKQGDNTKICALMEEWKEYIKYNTYNKEAADVELVALNKKYGLNLSMKFGRPSTPETYCSLIALIGSNLDASKLSDEIRVLENKKERDYDEGVKLLKEQYGITY